MLRPAQRSQLRPLSQIRKENSKTKGSRRRKCSRQSSIVVLSREKKRKSHQVVCILHASAFSVSGHVGGCVAAAPQTAPHYAPQKHRGVFEVGGKGPLSERKSTNRMPSNQALLSFCSLSRVIEPGFRGPRMHPFACRNPLEFWIISCLCQLAPVMFGDARLPQRWLRFDGPERATAATPPESRTRPS